MKNKFVYILTMAFAIMLTAFSACISSQSPFPVRGTGDLKNKTYDVTGFTGIDVSGGFDVTLVQGNSESLVLTAQENLFEYIKVNVENGILKVYIERNLIQSRDLKAKIFLKSIHNLKVSGGGDVASETPLDVPDLTVELSGGGDLKTTLKTGELRCHMSGGGDVDLNGEINNYNLDVSGGGDVQSNVAAGAISCTLSGGGDVTLKGTKKATSADISMSGGGDLKMDVDADEFRCSLSGGGDATLAGNAKNLNITINGGGDISASELTAEKASFKANGGSDIHINVTSELTGNISGGGNVYYSGNPAVVNIDAKGGSEVHKE